jgi:hypothetical protein
LVSRFQGAVPRHTADRHVQAGCWRPAAGSREVAGRCSFGGVEVEPAGCNYFPTSEVEAAAQELARRYGIEVAMVERQTEHLLSFRWRNSDETFAANVLCNEFYMWA